MHDLDVDALSAQLGHQPGGSLGETADRGDRRQLGSGEEHAHRPIMLARSNLRAMRSRRALVVSTLAATAIAGAVLDGPALAGDGDGDSDGRDKNVLLAEAQFQLLLVTADFVPSDITCTRPPVRDEAGELLCYALISDRVSVAAIATMQTPGVYTFLPLNKVDPADLGADDPTSAKSRLRRHRRPRRARAADCAGVGRAAERHGRGDPRQHRHRRRRRRGSRPRADRRTTRRSPPSTSSPSTHRRRRCRCRSSTDVADPAVRDEVAFFVTDVMAYFWMEGEPTREADATIRPRLEVTVDGVIYGTPFDVMVEVADYTITQDEWLEIVTGNAALPEYRQRTSVTRSTARRSNGTQPYGTGMT